MVAAADAQNYAQKLGITTDMVVQELGWDEDTDDGIRAAVEETIGGEMLDEDSDEVIDVVLLWWRDEDGDLVDASWMPSGPSPTKASCGSHSQDRSRWTRRAQRDRRIGADCRPDADIGSQPR